MDHQSPPTTPTNSRKERTIRVAGKIRGFAQHPVTRMVVGGILFCTALYEIEEGLLIELREGDVGSHHGIAAFGVLTMIAAIPDLLEGLVAASEYIDGNSQGEVANPLAAAQEVTTDRT